MFNQALYGPGIPENVDLVVVQVSGQNLLIEFNFSKPHPSDEEWIEDVVDDFDVFMADVQSEAAYFHQLKWDVSKKYLETPLDQKVSFNSRILYKRLYAT